MTRPAFPEDRAELDHVVRLIVENAAAIKNLDLDPEGSDGNHPANMVMEWLKPEIEKHGYLPESTSDVQFLPLGWPQDIGNLYAKLGSLLFGLTGSEEENVNELTILFLKVKTYIDDGIHLTNQAKKASLKKNARKATLATKAKAQEWKTLADQHRKRLLSNGMDERNIVSTVARLVNKHPSVVRRHFNK